MLAPISQSELFGHDAQGAVRSDEVNGLDALIAFRGQKQMLKEDRSAGSGGGDSKVLRRVIGQAGLPIFS
jgi:hypothetical protein